MKHTIIVAVGAGLLLLLGGAAYASETRRARANITYRIPEGVYVNAGTEAGLQPGLSGTMVLEGGLTLPFEVLHAARNTALLRLEGAGGNLVGSLQDRPVELAFAFEPAEDGADQAGDGAAVADAEPFVPLLAPIKRPPDYKPTRNISHGNVGVRQVYQGGTDNNLDYASTRIYTSGSIDRLFGTEWSFIWSGNARYRTGDGYRYHDEYEKLQPLIYSSYFQMPLAGQGFTRLGRFLPLELPGIGYIDGGQLEIDAGGHWRFGAVGGLKPQLVNLEFSGDEPTAVGYATYEAGNPAAAYYSGTAGLLGSLYKNEANRLAVLFDQRAGLGPKFNLYSSAEIDFGVANTTNSQTQLSRLDLTVNSKLHELLTLRAGAGHWQRADTPDVRDQFEYVDDPLFDDGYWRYWAGARHNLPWRLDLNEEVAYIVSDASDDAVRWRVGLTRTGLSAWEAASIGATCYNLESQGGAGYGGLLRAYLPFWNGRIAATPSASYRWMDPDNGGEGLTLAYYAVYLDGRISKAWSLSGGITVTKGDGADSTLFDLGLRYSW